MKTRSAFIGTALVCGSLWSLPVLPFSDYVFNLAARVLALVLLAGSFNLLMSYVGLAAFGHSAFFGIGGYAAAIVLRRSPGLDAAWVLIAALACGIVVAAAVGPIVLRASGIYFILLSLAVGQVIWGIADGWTSLTGGSDGLLIITAPRFIGIHLDSAAKVLRSSVAVCGLGIVGLYVITASPFGAAIRGVRESGGRMEALGYNVFLMKCLAFVLSAGFAAIAGGLLAMVNRFTSPDSMSVRMSVELVLIVVIGGRGHFWGPIVAAVALFLTEEMISLFTPEWPLVLGMLFMICVYGWRLHGRSAWGL